MQLMIPNAKDDIASDTLSSLPIEADIVQFLSATRRESSLTVLRQVRDMYGWSVTVRH
jgi:hypothetical protein